MDAKDRVREVKILAAAAVLVMIYHFFEDLYWIGVILGGGEAEYESYVYTIACSVRLFLLYVLRHGIWFLIHEYEL